MPPKPNKRRVTINDDEFTIKENTLMNKIEKKWDVSNEEIKGMIHRITDVILHEFLEMKKSKEQEEDFFEDEEQEEEDDDEDDEDLFEDDKSKNFDCSSIKKPTKNKKNKAPLMISESETQTQTKTNTKTTTKSKNQRK